MNVQNIEKKENNTASFQATVEAADFEKAVPIIVDAKTQYTAACNAVETLLINRKIAKEFLPKLYEALAAWAEDDFRSVNGQIEYLLTECVKQRKKDGKYVSQNLDQAPEFDIK